MGYSTGGKNAMLDYLATQVDSLSLHDGDPADNGANEISGGAYTREAVAWNAAAAGALDNTGTPVFDVPAGKTVRYVGLWTNGTYWGSADVADEAFTGAGTYTVNDLDCDLNA